MSNSLDAAQAFKQQLRGGTGHAATQSSNADSSAARLSPCRQTVQEFLQAWANVTACGETKSPSRRDAFVGSVSRLSAYLAEKRGGRLVDSLVETAWIDRGIIVWLPAGAKGPSH